LLLLLSLLDTLFPFLINTSIDWMYFELIDSRIEECVNRELTCNIFENIFNSNCG
jgi:hypothetical protein